jgi:hypothetical protein
VRRLAVRDLTTTVLTLTMTGLVADTTPPLVRARGDQHRKPTIARRTAQ